MLSGNDGIGVVGGEVVGGSFGDESLVEEPSDCSALSAGDMEALPHRHQVRVLLVQLVPEPAERSSAGECSGHALPGSGVADLLV